MLSKFTAGNYRSIYNSSTLSLQAEGISDLPDNAFLLHKKKYLKTIAIYGANSSGKSNIVKAMNMMKRILLSSVQLNSTDKLPYDPFLFSQNPEKSTFFEVHFYHNHTFYEYAFAYSQTEIKQEYLFAKKDGEKRERLFARVNDGIDFSSKHFSEGNGLVEKTNNNRLFLSLCGQLGGIVSNEVIGWFQNQINNLSGLDSENYSKYSLHQIHENKPLGDDIKKLFKNINANIEELQTSVINEIRLPNTLPEEIIKSVQQDLKDGKLIHLKSIHNVYDGNGSSISRVTCDFNNVESDGTQKLFHLSGPIFDSLQQGKVLIVDEFDAKLHPVLSKYLIMLFNNPNTNPNNAQLIFTTHDTNLLSNDLLRRDQIWFAEKDKQEQTELYSMMEVVLPDGSKPRNDANYQRNYLAGRYGAIPFILNNYNYGTDN